MRTSFLLRIRSHLLLSVLLYGIFLLIGRRACAFGPAQRVSAESRDSAQR
jgi:hypothetical protein